MYNIDFYLEELTADRTINEGDSIGVPYKINRNKVELVSRIGEFINVNENANARLVKTQGIGMSKMIVLEATRTINEGEIISVSEESNKIVPIEKYKTYYKEQFDISSFGLKKNKQFRMNNVSELMSVCESFNQCTVGVDRIELRESIERCANKFGVKVNLDETFNENYELYTESAGNPRRQKVESLVLKVFSTLDKAGINVEKYKDIFKGMNDSQFDAYMKNFLSDEEENFYLEIQPHKNEPGLKDIKAALDILNVPLDEYVYLRHEGEKDDPIRTRYRVPTGYIAVKRLQQILSKKNTYSLDIKSRNMKTGQVSGSDKIARISDSETMVLTAIGADAALKEFLGARADNMTSKRDMYNQISMYGYTQLEDLERDLSGNQTLNTISVYLTGAGIENDLLVDNEDK